MSFDLFGTLEPVRPSLNGDTHLGALKAARHGDIGEAITVVDLIHRGYEAAIQKGINTDVNVEVDGIYRRLQVKASSGQSFAPGGRSDRVGNGKDRPFGDYKGFVDGFALVHLASRSVYYVHIDAIAAGTRGVTVKNFSRDACNMSWAEMLRRFERA